ncbi:hypothetical protein TNCV_2342681 [Trichonephila clavipes]|nr:hypothetical protein TNCV_2342681 [Trichonephila clavipes]
MPQSNIPNCRPVRKSDIVFGEEEGEFLDSLPQAYVSDSDEDYEEELENDYDESDFAPFDSVSFRLEIQYQRLEEQVDQCDTLGLLNTPASADNSGEKCQHEHRDEQVEQQINQYDSSELLSTPVSADDSEEKCQHEHRDQQV